MENEEDEKTVTLTFQIVGPIRRAVVGDGDPEPRKDRLLDLLQWTWGCRVQLQRLKRSLYTDWWRSSDRSELEKTRRVCISLLDEHLLTIAAGNLEKARARAGRYYRHIEFSDKLLDLLKKLAALRDVYEHWEEHRRVFRGEGRPKSRAAHELSESFPSGSPWAVDYNTDSGDFVLAGIVSLQHLDRELKSFQKVLVAEWKKRTANPTPAADGQGRR